jgi:hypothetical protein
MAVSRTNSLYPASFMAKKVSQIEAGECSVHLTPGKQRRGHNGGYARVFKQVSGFGFILLSSGISSLPPAGNANRQGVRTLHP